MIEESNPLGETVAGYALVSLADQFDNGSLCPVIGAGLTMGVQMPSWGGLLSKCAKTAACNVDGMTATQADSFIGSYDYFFLGEYLQHHRTIAIEEFQQEFAEKLPIDFLLDQRTKAIFRLASLCIDIAKCAPDNAEFHAITYNYDTSLEEAIAKLGHNATAISLSTSRNWSAHGQPQSVLGGPQTVKVLHPHGVIPRIAPTNGSANLKKSKYAEHHDDVILLPTEYFHYLERSDRSMLNRQLEAFQSRTCLFFGFSFSDSGVRYLLRRAMEDYQEKCHRHVALMRTDEFQTTETTDGKRNDNGQMAKLEAQRRFGLLCVGGTDLPCPAHIKDEDLKWPRFQWKPRYLELLQQYRVSRWSQVCFQNNLHPKQREMSFPGTTAIERMIAQL